MKNIKNLGIKIGLIIILLLGIISYCVFSHGGYREYGVEESYKSLLNVLGNMVKNEGEIKITQDDINTLGTSYFKSNGNLEQINIEGFNVELANDEIIMRIPVKYKKLPLLLSSKGKISKDERYVIYTPEYFKVGKIKISNDFVLSFVEKRFANKIIVKESSIYLNKDKLFKEFEFVETDKGAIVIAAKNETKEILKKTNDSIKKAEEQVKKEMAKKAGVNKEDKITESKQSKNDNNIIKENNENKDLNRQNSLAKVNSNLGSLSSKVSGDKEQQMVSIMSYTVDRMESDPNYDFWDNADKVISIYKTLTPQEKKEFKQKFFSSVDMGNISSLKSQYGM